VRLWQKPLPHSAHLNGFSLLWMYLQRKDDFFSFEPAIRTTRNLLAIELADSQDFQEN
jgi:hypothetical protein